MSIFGNIGKVVPDDAERDARSELRAAERAYEIAEDRLIKARREYEVQSRRLQDFYSPRQRS